MTVSAVQNERQPRNTATIRPEALVEMDQERALREAAVAVGVFGYGTWTHFNCKKQSISQLIFASQLKIRIT